MELSAGTIQQQAFFRSQITTEVIKSSLDNQKAVANVIDQAARNIISNANRGSNVNIRA